VEELSMKVKELLRAMVAITVMVCAVAADAVADIPAPKAESTGIDWSFVVMGAVSAFLGALLFLWLGRKLFKKT
jgi:protein-S-isoprenylcysteine O-methyltransferase Ste14